MPSLAELAHVVHGQSQRTIVEKSMRGYMSQCKVMTSILNEDPDIRALTLVTDPLTGLALKHTGEASKIYKLKFPMSKEAGKLLFAALSIDVSLPRDNRRRKNDTIALAANEDDDDLMQDSTVENADVDDEEADNNHGEADIVDVVDPRNPAKDKQTVSGQTYQNYRSALKWWHTYDCAEWDKVGYDFPEDTSNAIKMAIETYKRDVGIKKRKGIMKQKEGKSKYNLFGLITICNYFCSMKPDKKKFTWNAGIFAGLFTKLSVNTIGRSDNIDDLILSMIDWENDAMTVQFGTTKADQTGETTSERKHIFANPFKPELCAILAMAVYTWCKRRTPGNLIDNLLYIYI